MVDSGCCSGTLVRQRLIDPVRALRFFYSMFWDSVPCIRSIPMHCFLDGVRVGRSSTSRRVFWTFRRLPSRCCGSLFPPLLLRRFSVLLLRQRRFFCPSFVWTVPDYSLQPLCFGSCTSTSYTTSGIGPLCTPRIEMCSGTSSQSFWLRDIATLTKQGNSEDVFIGFTALPAQQQQRATRKEQSRLRGFRSPTRFSAFSLISSTWQWTSKFVPVTALPSSISSILTQQRLSENIPFSIQGDYERSAAWYVARVLLPDIWKCPTHLFLISSFLRMRQNCIFSIFRGVRRYTGRWRIRGP